MKSKLFLSMIFLFSLTTKTDFNFDFGPQKYTEAQKDEMAPCRKHWRKDLAVCMEKHMKDKRIYRLNLLFLDKTGQRENYFEQALKSAEDYKKLEGMYDNNEDWTELWSVMSDDEKKQFFKHEDILLIASSKDNLKTFIKNKENQEWWDSFKRNVAIGATVVVVGGSIVVFTPVGPWIIGVAKSTASALSAKGAVVTAAGAAA